MRFLPGILVIVLHIYCWIEIAQSNPRQVRQLSKGVWVLISLVPVAGPVIWLIYGRPNGEAVTQPTPKPRPRVVAPDDDPDFLRSLRRPKPPPDDNPSR
jgi:hypothetical protein